MDEKVEDRPKVISHKALETGDSQAWTLRMSQEVGEMKRNSPLASVEKHEIVSFGLNNQEPVGYLWSTQLRELLILFHEI
jgi:ribulose 1,5-bisphosphate carboxylase large subunit-like protein